MSNSHNMTPQPDGNPRQPAPGSYGASPYGAGQSAPGPYGASPIPVPPKKKRKWPWIVGALVILIVIIAAVSGTGGEQTPTGQSSTAATGDQDKASEPTPGLRTPVRDGKFEFVVTGVEKGVASVGDNPYLTEQAQGQFVIVTMTVENISDEPYSFAPSDQKLTDTQGRSFDPSTSAQIALGGSDIPVWDNINPGNTVTAKVVYDMPKAAVPASIELHDSAFSGGVSVTLS